MKNVTSTFQTFVLLFIGLSVGAQTSGTINYISTQKIEMKGEGPQGVNLSDMIPSSMSSDMTLIFDKSKSLYKDGEAEEEPTEITSDDGSFQITLMTDDTEHALYTDHSTKDELEQEGFMGKQFLISSKLPTYKWKIASEKIKYLDYECIKATLVTEEGKVIVAWFTPAIPAQVGPDSYGQLPGAILMLSVDEGKLEIKATKVTLGDIDPIEKPTAGKKVTKEEYDIIVEEKLKEMKQNSGEGSFIIRG